MILLPTKYLVYGRTAGQGTIKDRELPFQSLWHIVAAPSRVNHSCQELNVHNISELSRFLQIEEPVLLHQLPDNLVSHLI